MERPLQRKYIDLIYDVAGKWANNDPPIPVKVGAYGGIERETGELRTEGNVYSSEFESELNRLGLSFRASDHPPLETDVEADYVISSKGAKRVNLNLEAQAITGLASASFKEQWQFEQGKRNAILIMQSPKIQYMPTDGILEKLLKVPMLKDKYLVTKVHVCPAYWMCLSNKHGEKVTVELKADVPVPVVPGVSAGGGAGIDWYSDAQSDFSRKGCDKSGRYCYSPLYAMKRRAGFGFLGKLFREGEEGEPNQAAYWDDRILVPWDPLDEDGEEDLLDLAP